MNRIFLLSPAYAGGRRAQMLMNSKAEFDLALRLRGTAPPTLGEVFAFLSGLYFRGKLAYATSFAHASDGICGVLVITPNCGLMPADSLVSLKDLRRFGQVDIDENDPRYRRPLERDVRRLARQLTPQCEVVLLGSVATGKYVDVLRKNLGAQLRFPAEFVGRGDMSRGGLLLRCAADGCELEYIVIDGAVRNGKRPPKLEPRRYPKGSA
jgi:hypothetical protein